jgi:hypothetical protein
MSTIERAAARLGAIGKRDEPRVHDRQEPALGPPTPSVSPEAGAAAAPAQRSVESAAGGAEPITRAAAQMFVGGGYVELDVDKLAAMGFVTGANVDSELATDFRRIKRPLLLSIKKAESEGGANPQPRRRDERASGEGKTFTSVNLALSVGAEMDLQCCDRRRRRSQLDHRRAWHQSQLGLTDVVARGGANIEDAVLKTNINGLR